MDPFVNPGWDWGKWSDRPELEAPLLRNEGTMHLTSSKEEWMRSQHRDTLGSMVQKYDELMHLSMAENVCPQRMRRNLLEKLANPLHLKRERMDGN